MKTAILITIVSMVASNLLLAQNPLSQKVQTEFGLGISIPFLNSGSELKRAESTRNNGQSYFQNAQGGRRNVGSYGSLIGWSFSTAYYRPVKKVDGLMLGTTVRASLTGTQPGAGYEEAYYFNFILVGFGAKYYPFDETNFFVKADGGMASVFTKNRYLNELNEQNFFHQFGIGVNGSVGVGYSFTPFTNKSKAIDLQGIYQQNSTRVEVNSIGSDQWNYGAMSIKVSLTL